MTSGSYKNKKDTQESFNHCVLTNNVKNTVHLIPEKDSQGRCDIIVKFNDLKHIVIEKITRSNYDSISAYFNLMEKYL